MSWPKGVKRGPRAKTAGRKPGVPNKNSQALRDMILQALNEQPGGGVGYLQRMARENQSTFGSLLGRVLPLAVTGADGEGPVVVEIVRFEGK